MLRVRLALALALSSSLAVAIGITAPASATVAGSNGLIYFDYWPSGSGPQIYSIDPVTEVMTDVSKRHYGDDQPAVSPAGTQIAFRNSGHIWVMSSTGSNRRDLTPGLITGSQPSWSPDGKQIVFNDNNHIDVMSSTGKHIRDITPSSDGQDPVWSPDGTAIGFTSYRTGGTAQVYTMSPTGRHVRDLSRNTAFIDTMRDWSPDSSHLVVESTRSTDGRVEGFATRRTGGAFRQITAAYPSGSYSQEYAPDGVSIAYTAYIDGSIEICVQKISAGLGHGQPISNLVGGSAENLSWARQP